jgi:hypothetical protein
VVKLRKLPSASDLDIQSDDRHLTEYQQEIIRSKLSKYRGTRLKILYAGGPKSLAYATEFRDLFLSLGWVVSGPRFVPAGDEGIIDTQVSVSDHYWNLPYPAVGDFMDSLASVKHRRRYVFDKAVSANVIVLWVGPRSPDNFRLDDCAPASLQPLEGEPHTCEIIAQNPTTCPFPPQ